MRRRGERGEVSRGGGVLPSVRAGNAHARGHGLRQRVSHRTLAARGYDPALGAGQPAAHPVLHRREGAGPAKVLLNDLSLTLRRSQMDARAVFEQLRKFDTPTICNALEIVRGTRFITGFTRQPLPAAFPALPPIVGYARTAQLRCSVPFDSAVRRQKLLSYYENLAKPEQPSIAVVQDIDS